MKDLDAVLDIEITRGRETLKEAFINRLEENIEVGETGYEREIAFPIPAELINKDKSVSKFIVDLGVISRMDNSGIKIVQELESIEHIPLVVFVVTITGEVNLEGIKRILNKGEI